MEEACLEEESLEKDVMAASPGKEEVFQEETKEASSVTAFVEILCEKNVLDGASCLGLRASCVSASRKDFGVALKAEAAECLATALGDCDEARQRRCLHFIAGQKHRGRVYGRVYAKVAPIVLILFERAKTKAFFPDVLENIVNFAFREWDPNDDLQEHYYADEARRTIVVGGLAFRLSTALATKMNFEVRRRLIEVSTLLVDGLCDADPRREDFDGLRLIEAVLGDAKRGDVKALALMESIVVGDLQGRERIVNASKRLDFIKMLASAQKEHPKAALSALNIIDCLAYEPKFLEGKNTKDLVYAVVHTLGQNDARANRRALRVFCKIAKLGLDEFGVYENPSLSLELKATAPIILDLLQKTTKPADALYALNALRFLAHNGHTALHPEPRFLEDILETIAQGALDTIQQNDDLPHNHARSSKSAALRATQHTQLLRTVAYRAQSLLQLIALV